MLKVDGEKMKASKELYAFRLMLTAKTVAHKKAIGHEPDHEQFKQIL